MPSDLTDNGCVGIYKLSNEYYVASETCNVLKVCKDTLNVQEKVGCLSIVHDSNISIYQINLDKVVGVNLASAHVQYIHGEPYAYNMSSSFMTGLKYHLLKIPLERGTNDKQDENANYQSGKVKST